MSSLAEQFVLGYAFQQFMRSVKVMPEAMDYVDGVMLVVNGYVIVADEVAL